MTDVVGFLHLRGHDGRRQIRKVSTCSRISFLAFSLPLSSRRTPDRRVPSAFTMRLDATDLRYITSEQFRVLTAVLPLPIPCSHGRF
jgi:hypothetical protein